MKKEVYAYQGGMRCPLLEGSGIKKAAQQSPIINRCGNKKKGNTPITIEANLAVF